jgi:uncharacterized protein (DUF1697 family)
MTKKTIKKTALIVIASGLLLNASSCKKPAENEEELITTLKVTLTDQASSIASVYQFRDTDGEGGNNPTQFDTIKLSPNKVYTCNITLLNESKTPAENITTEVEKEGEDHQFYYAPSSGLNATVAAYNADTKGLPLGTTCNWTTTNASTGKIQIILKHKPGIKASGDAVTIGETDIELPNGGFYTIIQ